MVAIGLIYRLGTLRRIFSIFLKIFRGNSKVKEPEIGDLRYADLMKKMNEAEPLPQNVGIPDINECLICKRYKTFLE